MNKLKRLLPAFLLAIVAFAAVFVVACSKATYTVSFESNGGSSVASQSVEEGGVASKPTDPTYEGYTFAGWYSQGEEYDFSTTVTSNITLVAQWTINSYTVTFDTDGGSTVASQTVNYGYTATQPATPTKTGYTFAGWYSGTTEYDFATAVTANITLTASWTANTYTVTFDSNGGSSVASQTVKHGETATEVSAYGWYEFIGWYDEDGELFDFDTAITSDITLYAEWDESTESEIMIVGMTIDTSAVKTEYVIGEDLETFGISLTLTVRNSNDNAEYETAVEGGIGSVTIDSSEYDGTTAGTYTIYVGYVISNITRWASYDVTVTSQISGTHGIELVKTTTEYTIVETGSTATAIDLTDLTVYLANEDGTLGDEITEGVTYAYYEGATKIEATDMTNGNVTYYQVWAYVDYKVGNEVYVMSDFVLIEIKGDVITELEWADGTNTQVQSLTDSMSSTWTLNATYSLTGATTIDLSKCTIGTDAGQYTVDIKTSVTGSYKAVVTYYYQLGNDVVSASCEVEYIISVATSETPYSVVIDMSSSSGTDYDAETVTPDATISATPSDGEAIIEGLVYAYGAPGYNKQGKSDTDSTNTLYGRIQFGTTKGITVYLGGSTTITLKALYGTTSDTKGASFVVKDSNGDTVVTSELISDKDNYVTVTLTIESAGIYTIVSSNGSLNTFRIAIEGNVGKNYTIVDYSVNSLTYTEDTTITENVALGDTFTLIYGSKKSTTIKYSADGYTVKDKTFSYQINMAGSKQSDDACSIKFEVTEAMLANGNVILTVYANHGASDPTTVRTLGVYATGKSGSSSYIYSGSVVGSGSIVTIEIDTAGTYYMGSASSGMCFYYMSLAYIATVTEVA